MNTVRDQENALFERWQQASDIHNFVPDGLIDEAAYLQSSPKVLFVLKDAYGAVEGEEVTLDLRDYGRTTAARQTWCTLARWSYGLQHIESAPDWPEIEQVGKYHQQRLQALRCTGLMNLKKECSVQAATNKEMLANVAKRDREFIREQWELYRPTVTVCGSWQVFNPLCNALGLNREERFVIRGVNCASTNGNGLIIEACHPAAQYPAYMKYYMVRDVVAHYLNQQA